MCVCKIRIEGAYSYWLWYLPKSLSSCYNDVKFTVIQSLYKCSFNKHLITYCRTHWPALIFLAYSEVSCSLVDSSRHWKQELSISDIHLSAFRLSLVAELCSALTKGSLEVLGGNSQRMTHNHWGKGQELVHKDPRFLASLWRTTPWCIPRSLLKRTQQDWVPVTHLLLGTAFISLHALAVLPGISSQINDLHPHFCLRVCSERTKTRRVAMCTVLGVGDSEQGKPMARCLESQNDVPKNWGNWKVSSLWNVALFLAVYISFMNSGDMPEGWHITMSFSENNFQGRWQAKQESQAHPAAVIHHTSVLILPLIISLSHKHLLSLLLGVGNKPGQPGFHTEATLSPDH